MTVVEQVVGRKAEEAVPHVEAVRRAQVVERRVEAVALEVEGDSNSHSSAKDTGSHSCQHSSQAYHTAGRGNPGVAATGVVAAGRRGRLSNGVNTRVVENDSAQSWRDHRR